MRAKPQFRQHIVVFCHIHRNSLPRNNRAAKRVAGGSHVRVHVNPKTASPKPYNPIGLHLAVASREALKEYGTQMSYCINFWRRGYIGLYIREYYKGFIRGIVGV